MLFKLISCKLGIIYLSGAVLFLILYPLCVYFCDEEDITVGTILKAIVLSILSYLSVGALLLITLRDQGALDYPIIKHKE